jgi:hypothetical protein
MKHTIYYGIVGTLVGTVTGACYVERTKVEHCAQQDGDAYCLRKYGAETTFCARGICDEGKHDGCGPVRPSSDACYSPCGGALSLADDPDCEGVAEGSSSSDTVATTDVTSEPTGGPTTMGSMSASGSETESASTTTTGGGACEDSTECTDPLAPICGATMCVPCLADEECLAKGSGAPVCREDGQCVACTPSNIGACEGTTPVCGALNECEGCGFHEQCPASACDIATGECFEEDCVVEVDGDGGAEYEDIQDAIVDGCVVIVHELNGGVPYNENLEIDGIGVAVLRAEGEDPIVAGVAGNPSLSVTGGAVAYVQGLTFSGNTMAEGVSVNGANLYLDRSQIVANSATGITLANNAIAQVRNCFVALNGNQFQDDHGISVNSSSLDLSYSTVVANDGNGADSLECTAAVATVRDSILLGADASSIDCPSVDAASNALDEAAAGNVNVGALNPAWFDSFPDDFHLTPLGAGVFEELAQWNAGDPPADIDGDARPTEEGAADFAGADVP